MEAPRIQYTKTKDTVSVAFWSIGEGPPLVMTAVLAPSHARLDWEVPLRVATFQRLAQRANLVHYDHRGMGMSQRDAIDFSVDAGLLDLEAVVDQLRLEKFALLGVGQSR